MIAEKTVFVRHPDTHRKWRFQAGDEMPEWAADVIRKRDEGAAQLGSPEDRLAHYRGSAASRRPAQPPRTREDGSTEPFDPSALNAPEDDDEGNESDSDDATDETVEPVDEVTVPAEPVTTDLAPVPSQPAEADESDEFAVIGSTVAEIKAHLDENPSDAARVLDIETARGDEARVTVIKAAQEALEG